MLTSWTGHGLRDWAVGWALLAPTVFLVPAFGLRALPGAARVALGLGLAACGLPGLQTSPKLPFELAVVVGLLRGLPIALVAATALWAASMAGGLIDDLRGGRDTVSMPVLGPDGTPIGVLFGLVAAIAFLTTGGPARVMSALLLPFRAQGHSLQAVARTLASGIELAVAIAAPIVVVLLLFEIAAVLVARAATPAPLQSTIAPLRGLVVLAVLAVVMERIFVLLVQVAGAAP